MPQKISFVLRPKEMLEMPWSEGYQLYSAILNIMQHADEEISRHIHNSPISSISISALNGKFKMSKRPKHKVADPANSYNFSIGITDPKEAEIFRSIIQPLILKEQDIQLDKGGLRVEEATSTTENFEDILAAAGRLDSPFVEFNFYSPTCIQYRNTKVLEMFPHREAVFLLDPGKVECGLSRGS